MKTCPKCMRELKKVFNSDSGDEVALESLDNEIILGNCYVDAMNFLKYEYLFKHSLT